MPGGYFMKKIISILAICLSLSVESNAMKRTERLALEQSDDSSLVNYGCPDEVLQKIVLLQDYEEFIAFALTCKRINLICTNMPLQYLKTIIFKAAFYGNIKLVCKFANVSPKNLILKQSAKNIFSLWLVCPDKERLAFYLLPTDVTEQDCKDELLLAVEFATPRLVMELLHNEKIAGSIDQDCVDAVINKCIELKREELYIMLLGDNDVCDKMSFELRFSLLTVTFPEEFPNTQGVIS